MSAGSDLTVLALLQLGDKNVVVDNLSLEIPEGNDNSGAVNICWARLRWPEKRDLVSVYDPSGNKWLLPPPSPVGESSTLRRPWRTGGVVVPLFRKKGFLRLR